MKIKMENCVDLNFISISVLFNTNLIHYQKLVQPVALLQPSSARRLLSCRLLSSLAKRATRPSFVTFICSSPPSTSPAYRATRTTMVLVWMLLLCEGRGYRISQEIGGVYVSVQSAGNLSTLFDVGGIVGGIVAGYLSDKLNARATTAATFMYLAIPSMLVYRCYGGVSRNINIALMMLAGLFVNGPYALITTAVSADLGTHRSLKGDSRALATVAAIIDGTGSVGAALGPLLTGFLSTRGWDAVFLMLMFGALIAGLLLTPLIITEISDMFKQKQSNNTQSIIGSVCQPLLINQR